MQGVYLENCHAQQAQQAGAATAPTPRLVVASGPTPPASPPTRVSAPPPPAPPHRSMVAMIWARRRWLHLLLLPRTMLGKGRGQPGLRCSTRQTMPATPTSRSKAPSAPVTPRATTACIDRLASSTHASCSPLDTTQPGPGSSTAGYCPGSLLARRQQQPPPGPEAVAAAVAQHSQGGNAATARLVRYDFGGMVREGDLHQSPSGHDPAGGPLSRPWWPTPPTTPHDAHVHWQGSAPAEAHVHAGFPQWCHACFETPMRRVSAVDMQSQRYASPLARSGIQRRASALDVQSPPPMQAQASGMGRRVASMLNITFKKASEDRHGSDGGGGGGGEGMHWMPLKNLKAKMRAATPYHAELSAAGLHHSSPGRPYGHGSHQISHCLH